MKKSKIALVLSALVLIIGTVSCNVNPNASTTTGENPQITTSPQTEEPTKAVTNEPDTADPGTETETQVITSDNPSSETTGTDAEVFLTGFEVKHDVDKDGNDDVITLLYNVKRNLVTIDVGGKGLTLQKSNVADYYQRDPEPFYGVKQTTFADIDSDGLDELIICTVNTMGNSAFFNVIDFDGTQPVEVPFSESCREDGEVRYIELLKAEAGDNGVYTVKFAGEKLDEINAGKNGIEGGASMPLYTVKEGKLCLYTVFTQSGADKEVFVAYEISFSVKDGTLKADKASVAADEQKTALRSMF